MKLNLNTWRILGMILIILFLFLFFNIVIYLAVSLLLFLLGYPITYRLEKIRIGGKNLPNGLASLITLVLMMTAVSALFLLIVPPLVDEINFLSQLNFYEVLYNVLEEFPRVKALLFKFGTEEDLKTSVSAQVSAFMNANNISLVLNNLFAYLGAFLGGALCVLFITFFFLKDERLVKDGLLLLTPSGTETTVQEILRTCKRMLTSYFTALVIDMLAVGCAVMLALWVLDIRNALVIAFCAALLNVIPYIGSVITMMVAVLLGVSSCISAGSYELIGPVITKIFLTLLCINLADGFILQPLLFSNSVKAHPLEVFIVTLIAGSMGGIIGMVIALPAYTLIRVVAKEFLTHLKFFKKISDTISS